MFLQLFLISFVLIRLRDLNQKMDKRIKKIDRTILMTNGLFKDDLIVGITNRVLFIFITLIFIYFEFLVITRPDWVERAK